MDNSSLAAQQFFPTYSIDLDHKEIVIKEYESAVRTLESEERLFATAVAISVFLFGLVGWFAPPKYEVVLSALSSHVGRWPIIVAILLTIIAASTLVTLYFGEMQRSLVHAGRKAIILRRMLGLNYGRVELVLPADRVEGANEPFSLRMFPGWKSYKCFPIYAIAFISAAFILLLVTRHGRSVASSAGIDVTTLAVGAALLWALLLLELYRAKLSDQHENRLLRFAKSVAFTQNIRLVLRD